MNTDTFETIAADYRRRLLLYAVRKLRNHDDAEDAVQDVLLRAYRAWCRGAAQHLDAERLRAWFFTIALNVIRTRLRRKVLAQVSFDEFHDPESWHPALEDGRSPAALLDQHTTVALVECAIGKLPSHLLECARLRFIEGLTHPQIAEQCSQPIGTVKARVYRARQRLRRALKPLLDPSALVA